MTPPLRALNPNEKARDEEQRQALDALLGDGVIGARFVRVDQTGRGSVPNGARIDLDGQTEAGERVPLTLLLPATMRGPVPAIVYCHAHGNDYTNSRLEVLEGRPSLQGPYAPDLLDAGYAVLAMDMPAFGERQEPGEQTRAKAHLLAGKTLFGQMLHELVCGVSFLTEHPAIASARIGTMGFSMGSTHAFWLAALDRRVRAAAALCSFADLGTLVESGAHEGHGLYMTVPGLLGATSTGQIAGLAAPRSLFIGAGMQDWSTPPDAFARARAELEAAYADAPTSLRLHIEPDSGHEETPAMRKETLSFLKEHL
ncbi:MAG: prolyl oligopeptidase family serine peptidase [Devosiaceae bacterium]|nr:prolyl oligopeptidase family serine peptidase [Devosiaceae bacterium MH13]